MRQDSGMRVENQIHFLFREDSVDPIDLIFLGGEDTFLESSSQGVSTDERTPPASFPGMVGDSKNHRFGLPPRRVNASQPVQKSRNLRPRNGIRVAPPRARSINLIQSSSSTDSLAKAPLGKLSCKLSTKRKLKAPEDDPRTRKKMSSPPSEKSENTGQNEPMPGRTDDGKIDYRYYITKYLNQRG
ncbi:unnamed protein product [Rhizoctonia solani]|uniref:Uncharacterized protein n=1 Tax=Rhizoctonia solani TaxID=456999 RepID=A0A8H3B616_9AGAM|nr:unnamed protein product [Rhizoctonia solani]